MLPLQREFLFCGRTKQLMTLTQRALAITLLPAIAGIIISSTLGALCLDIVSVIKKHAAIVRGFGTDGQLGNIYLAQLETIFYWTFGAHGSESEQTLRSLQKQSAEKLQTFAKLYRDDKEVAPLIVESQKAHEAYIDTQNTFIARGGDKLALTGVERKRLYGYYARTRQLFKQVADILLARSAITLKNTQNKALASAYIVATGFTFNLLMCTVLLYLFARHIASRMNSLQKSALALSCNRSVQPQLVGGDEIAQLEVKLIALSSELESARKRKQEFLALVSHDLRSPLTSLQMSLDLFGKGVYGEFSVEGRRLFRMHAKNMDRLVTIISDLLDLEKIEANLLQSAKSNTELNQILKQLQESVSEQFLTDRLSVNPCGQCTICCDPDQFEAALNRIIALCLYASTQEVLVTAHTEEPLEVTINVEAFGPIERGINKKDPFNRFASTDQAEPLIAEHRHGLALAKQLIGLHSGEVKFSSTPKSIRFQIILPKIAENN